MDRSVFRFLLGAVFIYYQVFAFQEQIHVGELMVESNITLNGTGIVSILGKTSQIQVAEGNTVTHLYSELVSECVSAGDNYSCHCSAGYIWSIPVCYNYSCCRESECTANVLHLVPLCIPKVFVSLTVTVERAFERSVPVENSAVTDALQKLHGLESITGPRQSGDVMNFQANLSVRVDTPRLQEMLTDLENLLNVVVHASTQGMVVMETPTSTVHYLSKPVFKCLLEEATDQSEFTLIPHLKQSVALSTGKLVQLDSGCTTDHYNSCLELKLCNVTSTWSGQYECVFTVGSVTHKAKGNMTVAPMPDHITMEHSPPTADCSGSEDPQLHFNVTIKNTMDTYQVCWSYLGGQRTEIQGTSNGDTVLYTFSVTIECSAVDKQDVNVIFTNEMDDKKCEKAIVPVILAGAKFCHAEEAEGHMWPKTPDKSKVVTRSCPKGRVGKKSRTCNGNTWLPVFSECVNERLSEVVNAADNAVLGLGVSQMVVKDIFGNLKDISTDENARDMADISAGISVLNKMSQVSANFPISEEVLPDMVHAASNMLNKTWDGEPDFLHNLSADYLYSMEGLVKNIKINNSKDLKSPNMELKFCSGVDCSVTVFNISVNLTTGNGSVKTFGARNLTDKLKNNYENSSSLLLSATLNDSHASNVKIQLNFPSEHYNSSVPHCVFWNTSTRQWSEEGCIVINNDENGIMCECNHLTSFSVLMSKSDVSNDVLDMITSVGLGVSVCCLVIFLAIEALVWGAVVKSNLSLYRHTSMVNIATFLLLGDASFLASTHPNVISDSLCLTFTICKHLFFLAMFCWMMCLSLILVYQLIFVFNPMRKRVFMFLSSFIGYVCPILIVGCSYVYYRYTKKPYFDKDLCWLKYERLLVGSMHAFFIPVAIIVFTNMFCILVVILSLLKTSAPDGTKNDKDTLKSIIKVIVFLIPIFGVTWLFGFIIYTSSKGERIYTFAEYAFTILNSLQGLFILLEGVFAEKKVRMELLRILTSKTKRNQDSMRTSITKTK